MVHRGPRGPKGRPLSDRCSPLNCREHFEPSLGFLHARARAQACQALSSNSGDERGTMVGATPEDMVMASKLVTISPGYLSKWTKAELTSAALAMRLFVQELPGGPKLLHRAADLAMSSNGDELERMSRATGAIRCQEGVDASLFQPSQMDGEDPTATSTQAAGAGAPGAPNVSLIPNPGGVGDAGRGRDKNWLDPSYTQIPSGQGDVRGDSGGRGRPDSSNSDTNNGSSSRKVSDSNTNSYVCYTNPPPHDLAPRADVKGIREGGVDAVAGGPVVARGGDGGGDVVGVKDQAPESKRKLGTTVRTVPGLSTERTTRICNRVWKGLTCKKEHAGCRFAHPVICSNTGCGGSNGNNCNAFHPAPRPAGNGRGGTRKGDGAPTRAKPNPRQTSGRSSSNKGSLSTRNGTGGKSGNRGSNRNNNSNRSSNRKPTYSQLEGKLAAMRLQMSKDLEIKRELKELKEMTGLMGSSSPTYATVAASHNSSKGWWARDAGEGTGTAQGAQAQEEGFAHARLPPGLMDAVMTAVMSVMADGGRVLKAGGDQRRVCRC